MVAGPAQAASSRPLDEKALANSSLSATDIPRWMRHGAAPQVEQFFSKGRDAGGPLVCPSGETPSDFIRGKRARELMYSRAILWEVPPSKRAQTGSYIFQYSSRDDAERAWEFLNAQANTCPSFVKNETSDSGRARTEVDTRVRTLPDLFGTPGLEVWTSASNRFTSDEPKLTTSYTADALAHYYLAGTSIVQVEHQTVNGDSRGVGRVTRGFVETMAIVVAQRVEQRSSR
jgi:hypothetical protein